MEILDVILKRRSIRKFKSDELPQGTIEKLLRAAMAAPCAGNQRPWQFITITEQEGIDTIVEAYPYSKIVQNAPAAIIVCFDKTLEKYDGYWTMDCAAATENILIAATGMGLGSLWLSVYPEEGYHKLSILYDKMGIPEHVIPFSIVPIGYISEDPEPRERFDESIIHTNKW